MTASFQQGRVSEGQAYFQGVSQLLHDPGPLPLNFAQCRCCGCSAGKENHGHLAVAKEMPPEEGAMQLQREIFFANSVDFG